jgi:hypothetical protein
MPLCAFAFQEREPILIMRGGSTGSMASAFTLSRTHLFMPERHHGIYFGRLTGRNVAG